MLETIAVGVISSLLAKLGERAMDRFWAARTSGVSASVDQSGQVTRTAEDAAGRTVVTPRFTVPQGPALTRVFGEFYLNEVVAARMSEVAVPVVLVADLERDEMLLFDADLGAGYELDTAPGQYLMIMLLVDGTSPSFEDAWIFAYGFPSREDLSGIGEFEVDTVDGFWQLIEDEPLTVPATPSAYLDFLVVDADDLPGYPRRVADLLEAPVTGLLCPRCGGDGYVGYDDLQRLRAEGHQVAGWLPGPCRLCGGTGLVTADFELYRDIGNTPREHGY